MTKQEFRELVQAKTLLLDGATGSNLMKEGMPRGVCSEQWIYENPKVLQKLQREYREAGSVVVYAPTFSANRISLANHGLEDKVEELNRGLVHISREAVGEQCYVAGDLTTTGKQDVPYEELFEAYKEQITVLADAGVDLLIAETMLGVDEVMAVLDAAAAVCELPVMCTLTVESDGSLFFGGNIYEAVETLEQMGADAVGINCSTGPDQLVSVVKNIRERVRIPVIVKPNAGMPVIDEKGNPVYSMGAEEFAGHMKTLAEAGADIVGGCCGTTPAYIRKLAEVLK
ncbi:MULTISPECIES: homocysteine S-methyltransferase family protein [Blautia]|uniref:homocysteine S-methyltransferase family protein n=1 Tax=Blautia TaxID=572511 RepID=UPI000BA45881|nr:MULTISPECIES: homocysteine S-methyltransferase family protein [Blautia]